MSDATASSLPLDQIRIDGGTQPRCEINYELVSEYEKAMQDGAVFPPLVVYFDSADYWLADGFHRWHAARQARLDVITCEVYTGSQRDAILHSVGSNATHGKRRTNADKWRAVKTLLADEEWSGWSDSEIARRCAVHHTTVASIRASLTCDLASEVRTYRDRHGNVSTMNTAKIGRTHGAEQEDDFDGWEAPDDESDEPDLPSEDTTHLPVRTLGPPRFAMQFARMAIADLEQIRDDDAERADAFDMVTSWIEERTR